MLTVSSHVWLQLEGTSRRIWKGTGVELELPDAEGAAALAGCFAAETPDDCAEAPRAEVSRLCS